MVTYLDTLNDFLASDNFPAAVHSSTTASWGGRGYAVELFPEGTWRVLWRGQIGNRYETPGVLLAVPTADEEWGDLSLDEVLDEAIRVNRADLAQEMRDDLAQETTLEEAAVEAQDRGKGQGQT